MNSFCFTIFLSLRGILCIINKLFLTVDVCATIPRQVGELTETSSVLKSMNLCLRMSLYSIGVNYHMPAMSFVNRGPLYRLAVAKNFFWVCWVVSEYFSYRKIHLNRPENNREIIQLPAIITMQTFAFYASCGTSFIFWCDFCWYWILSSLTCIFLGLIPGNCKRDEILFFLSKLSLFTSNN